MVAEEDNGGGEWTEERVGELIARMQQALEEGKMRPELVARPLMALYRRQTDNEQRAGETRDKNAVGFNGADAPILSSLAEQWRAKGWMSKKQARLILKLVGKYRRQLAEIANQGGGR